MKRLALFLPPGSAKSTYASMVFPAWYFSRHPQANIIAASHTAELAERFGRRVRSLVNEHADCLGVGVSEDSAAAGRWDTTHGGEYFACGVGGSVTGRRGDCVLIDDPVRSREDADSELIREKQWDWYKFDLATRLKPDASVVLIQTRWHELDLAGRLLQEEGDRWKVISLPMEATSLDDPLGRKIGDPLWPQWFNDEMRKDAKRDARVWQSLYQQNPVAEEGNLFKREWVKVIDYLPNTETMRFYGAADYAVTSGGGDYSVILIVGVDSDDKLYLVDLWRGQTSPDVWVEKYCDLVREWRPMSFAEEQGQIRSGVGPFLERRARERGAYSVREQFPTRGDKAVRCASIRGRMAMGGLHVLRSSPWKDDLINELVAFPAGAHDDQVDALGLIGQLLDTMLAGEKPRPAEPVRPRDYGMMAFRNDDDYDDGDWKSV